MNRGRGKCSFEAIWRSDKEEALSRMNTCPVPCSILFNLFELIYCNLELVDDVDLLWTHRLTFTALDA